MSSGFAFAILAGALMTAGVVVLVAVCVRTSRFLGDPQRAWSFMESRSSGGGVLLAAVDIWMMVVGVLLSGLGCWAVWTGRAGWDMGLPITVGLAGASLGGWLATTWPYYLDRTGRGIELSLVWGRRRIAWSDVDWFRYFGAIGYPAVLGVQVVLVRLRYRREAGERRRSATATFMLPVMDVGPPAEGPVYVTVLDRQIPERRLGR